MQVCTVFKMSASAQSYRITLRFKTWSVFAAVEMMDCKNTMKLYFYALC